MMTMQRIHAPRASRGFTLLELMIVIAVLGVLGAIAYPNYQEYARKGRRAEARAALQELLQQQERYMTQFNTYREFSLGAQNVPFTTKVQSGNRDVYTLKAEACGTSERQGIRSCVKLTAHPLVADAKAGDLTLTSQKEKDCTGTDKRTCWP